MSCCFCSCSINFSKVGNLAPQVWLSLLSLPFLWGFVQQSQCCCLKCEVNSGREPATKEQRVQERRWLGRLGPQKHHNYWSFFASGNEQNFLQKDMENKTKVTWCFINLKKSTKSFWWNILPTSCYSIMWGC